MPAPSVAAAPTDGPVLGTRILQSEACADAQFVIAALLPPRDAAALSGVNKDYYFIARSPLIWASHVQHIRKTNPEVQAPLAVYDDPYEEYKGLRAAGERHSAEELVSHVKSFKEKELLLLRTFGTVTEPGTESATFEPNGPISLPVPAQLALELLFALDNVPSSKAAPVTGDVYAKVASILSVNKTSLRNLRDKTVGNTRRPLDLARRLAAPFGAPAEEGGSKRGRRAGKARKAAAPALDGATVGLAPDPERRPLPPVALPRGGAERLQQRNVALVARMDAEAEAHAATATSLRVEQRARAQLTAEVQRLRERLQDAAHVSDQQRLAANARIDTLNGTIQRMQAQAERLRLAAASARAAEQAAREGRGEAQLRAFLGQEHQRRLAAERRVDELAQLLAASEWRGSLAEQACLAAEQRAAGAEAGQRSAEAAAAEARAREAASSSSRSKALKRRYAAEALEQSQTGKISPSKRAVVAAVVGRPEVGDAITLNGQRFVRVPAARVGSSDTSERQDRRRTRTTTQVLGHLAGGEEHVVSLMQTHARANPRLYAQLGEKLNKKLSTEETVTLVGEMTGALGECVRGYLKGIGVQIANRSEVRAALRAGEHTHETGTFTVADEKSPSKTKTAAWIRVVDLLASVQQMVSEHAAAGDLEWPSSCKDSEIQVVITADKGGDSTKWVLKLLNTRHADSTRSSLLLALLTKVKDVYVHVQTVFEPIYRQANVIEALGLTVMAPWKPRFNRAEICLARQHPNGPNYPVRAPPKVAAYDAGKAVRVMLSVLSFQYGGSAVSLSLQPRAQQSRRAASKKAVVPAANWKGTRKQPSAPVAAPVAEQGECAVGIASGERRD
ncbi:hypothetical protein EMIHUDRAFT_228573 [Emiliania huxleyi CCMP1516]|uniref:Uncharacterized protein n=2 Tax=Emiliania huxleyi TaxID=2903 RepID=A0A0D3KFP7_EMIH1|nr:hypothetical protein EMIHUDRAFT_228573 [Emiliania huxleyi CCMP1516]EOD34582.1 hypothetical protein EMIHUDRAFT_228573 [Emiliania huxleyi CCMP1516]|eukprot:XP_005787011.1 hypothetical protein EMIHUDRAFT_228573 [Emiliania huxleyi CCMP1516]